ncbi:hypothetical protein V8K53_000610 [Listeria monocytogenes]
MKIEFRGKRLRSSEWVHGFYYEERGFSYITVVTDKPGEIPVHLNVPVRPKTVGQYTNLNDKNGKKIFEGDVVKWGDTLGGEERPIRIATVKINPDIQFDSNVGIFNYGQFAYKNTEKFLTILGNIHDNPELLEVSE